MSFVRAHLGLSIVLLVVCAMVVVASATFLLQNGEGDGLTEDAIREAVRLEIEAFAKADSARTDSLMAGIARGDRQEGESGAQPWLDLVSALRREHSNIMRNQSEQRAIELEIRGMVVRYLCWVSRGLDPACGTASAVPTMTHSTRPAP